ncbi:hypothetical protein Syun_017496 [Stephania yunnanensis]|uniref:Uncharacterized protein n=1 Tax=Stephania yunnanensis TaxID=152371 RepID=A0AAP0J710_9MAGN
MKIMPVQTETEADQQTRFKTFVVVSEGWDTSENGDEVEVHYTENPAFSISPLMAVLPPPSPASLSSATPNPQKKRKKKNAKSGELLQCATINCESVQWLSVNILLADEFEAHSKVWVPEIEPKPPDSVVLYFFPYHDVGKRRMGKTTDYIKINRSG